MYWPKEELTVTIYKDGHWEISKWSEAVKNEEKEDFLGNYFLSVFVHHALSIQKDKIENKLEKISDTWRVLEDFLDYGRME